MRVSVSFSGFGPLTDSFEAASLAQGAGFDGAWYCEHVGFHDAVAPTAVMLDRYPALDIGVVGPAPVSRHPALLAMELGSLAELGPGRVRAQLGLGDARLVRRIGGVGNSLATVREYVLATRSAMRGDALEGTFAKHVFDGYQTMASPQPPKLDIMAIRPKMIALSAEIGDGISLSTGASVEYLGDTVTTVERELEAAGKPRNEFRVTAQVLGALGDTTEEAASRIASTFMIFSPEVLAILAPGKDPNQHAAQMGIACTEQTLVERLAEYQAVGMGEVAIDFAHAPDELPDVMAAFGRALAQLRA